MDVKPDNIFISCEPMRRSVLTEDSADDGFEDESNSVISDDGTEFSYKIGDLGHVTSMVNPKVEEGDCRYLPRELLLDDFSALAKVDIFALGLTMYEAASSRSLPLNGPEWQNIRNGDIPFIPGYSPALQDLLKLMIHNDPKLRPTAAEITNHEIFNVTPTKPASKSRFQLRKELAAAKHKNNILEKQLLQAKSVIQNLSPASNGTPISDTLEPNPTLTSPFLVFNPREIKSGIADSTSPPHLIFNGYPSANLVNNFVNISFGHNEAFPTTPELGTGAAQLTGSFKVSPISLDSNVDNKSSSSNDVTCNNNKVAPPPAPPQPTVRQCPYNTRSAKLKSSSRIVGKKTARSQSLL